MKQRFAFGKNWQCYLKKRFSEEQVLASCESMRPMLGTRILHGLSFFDIGSGLTSCLHTSGTVCFSASDNTSPHDNGRDYSFYVDDDTLRQNSLYVRD